MQKQKDKFLLFFVESTVEIHKFAASHLIPDTLNFEAQVLKLSFFSVFFRSVWFLAFWLCFQCYQIIFIMSQVMLIAKKFANCILFDFCTFLKLFK